MQRAKAVDPSVTERANELISTYSRHTPQAKDLFMLGYKAGDRITIGGWIGEIYNYQIKSCCYNPSTLFIIKMRA